MVGWQNSSADSMRGRVLDCHIFVINLFFSGRVAEYCESKGRLDVVWCLFHFFLFFLQFQGV